MVRLTVASKRTGAKHVSDQIHLVLNLEELATIVLALRAAELHGFADRLNTLAQRIEPPTEK